MNPIFPFAAGYFQAALIEEYRRRIILAAERSEITGGERLPPAYAAALVKAIVK